LHFLLFTVHINNDNQKRRSGRRKYFNESNVLDVEKGKGEEENGNHSTINVGSEAMSAPNRLITMLTYYVPYSPV
jgi:hypothetical protein